MDQKQDSDESHVLFPTQDVELSDYMSLKCFQLQDFWYQMCGVFPHQQPVL